MSVGEGRQKTLEFVRAVMFDVNGVSTTMPYGVTNASTANIFLNSKSCGCASVPTEIVYRTIHRSATPTKIARKTSRTREHPRKLSLLTPENFHVRHRSTGAPCGEDLRVFLFVSFFVCLRFADPRMMPPDRSMYHPVAGHGGFICSVAPRPFSNLRSPSCCSTRGWRRGTLRRESMTSATSSTR